jgi:hypothetical protein
MADVEAHYYRRRAEAELKRARAASCEAASTAHFMLAGLYFDRAAGQGGLPAAPLVPPHAASA